MRISPSTFVSITSRSSSSCDSHTGSRPRARPALLTRMSRPPSSATASSTNRRAARRVGRRPGSRRAASPCDAGARLLERPRRRGADAARRAGDDRPSSRPELPRAHPRRNVRQQRIGAITSKFQTMEPPAARGVAPRAGAPRLRPVRAARRGRVREPQRLRPASHARATPGYVSYAFTSFLILFVLAIPVAIYGVHAPGARGRGQRARASSQRVIRELRDRARSSSASWFVVIYLKRHHHATLQQSPAGG